MRSHWLLPAVAFAAVLCLCCVPVWPAPLPVTPLAVLSAIATCGVMAFSLALSFESAQWLRRRFPRHRELWSAGLLIVAMAFGWVVGVELVRSVSGLAVLGYSQAIGLSLAGACVLALYGLRAQGFGGRGLTLLSNVVLVGLLLWAQTRYRMQLREAKYASVSAGFLLLTGFACMRLVERLQPPSRTNLRGFLALLVLLGMSIAG
jgi:hypothetical protein